MASLSSNVTTCSLPGISAALGNVRGQLRPFGFWRTLGFALFAAAVGFLVEFYAEVRMLTHRLRFPNSGDSTFSTVEGMLPWLAAVVVLVALVKMKGFSLGYYFALRWGALQRRELVLGIACVTGLIVVFESMESLLGMNTGSKYFTSMYQAAATAGLLPLLWLGVVVVAPITEELIFRGFLYRGWALSPIGVAGSIFLTSALWALLHQQYDWPGIVCIFVAGVIFCWLRKRSGSTAVPILLHAFINLYAMLVATIQIGWLS